MQCWSGYQSVMPYQTGAVCLIMNNAFSSLQNFIFIQIADFEINTWADPIKYYWSQVTWAMFPFIHAKLSGGINDCGLSVPEALVYFQEFVTFKVCGQWLQRCLHGGDSEADEWHCCHKLIDWLVTVLKDIMAENEAHRLKIIQLL